MRVIYHLFTFSFACVMIYPLVWMIMGSFKDTTEIFRHAEHLLPQSFHLGNYIKGWKGFANVSFTVFFKNSLIINLREKEYGSSQCFDPFRCRSRLL